MPSFRDVMMPFNLFTPSPAASPTSDTGSIASNTPAKSVAPSGSTTPVNSTDTSLIPAPPNITFSNCTLNNAHCLKHPLTPPTDGAECLSGVATPTMYPTILPTDTVTELQHTVIRLEAINAERAAAVRTLRDEIRELTVSNVKLELASQGVGTWQGAISSNVSPEPTLDCSTLPANTETLLDSLVELEPTVSNLNDNRSAFESTGKMQCDELQAKIDAATLLAKEEAAKDAEAWSHKVVTGILVKQRDALQEKFKELQVELDALKVERDELKAKQSKTAPETASQKPLDTDTGKKEVNSEPPKKKKKKAKNYFTVKLGDPMRPPLEPVEQDEPVEIVQASTQTEDIKPPSPAETAKIPTSATPSATNGTTGSKTATDNGNGDTTPWEQLQAEHVALKKENKDIKTAHDSLVEQHDALHDRLQVLKQVCKDMQQEHERLAEERDDFKTQRDVFDQDSQDLAQVCKDFKVERDQLKATVTKLAREIADSNLGVNHGRCHATVELETLQQKYDVLKREVDTGKMNVDSAKISQTSLDALRKTHHATLKERDNLKTARNALKTELGDMKLADTAHRRELATVRSELTALKNNTKSSTLACKHLKADLEKARQKIALSQEELAAAKATLESTSTAAVDQHALITERATLDAEMKEFMVERKLILGIQKSLTTELEQARQAAAVIQQEFALAQEKIASLEDDVDIAALGGKGKVKTFKGPKSIEIKKLKGDLGRMRQEKNALERKADLRGKESLDNTSVEPAKAVAAVPTLPHNLAATISLLATEFDNLAPTISRLRVSLDEGWTLYTNSAEDKLVNISINDATDIIGAMDRNGKRVGEIKGAPKKGGKGER